MSITSSSKTAAAMADCLGKVCAALTDVASTGDAIKAASFATVMAGNATSAPHVMHDHDLLYDIRQRIANGDHGLLELVSMIPGYFDQQAISVRVDEILTRFAHELAILDRRDISASLDHHILTPARDNVSHAISSLKQAEIKAREVKDALSVLQSSSAVSDAANLRRVDNKTKFDTDMTFVVRKMKELQSHVERQEEAEKESESVEENRSLSRRSRRIELDEIDKDIKRIEKKVDRIKNDVVNFYDSSLRVKGGSNAKSEKVYLNIKALDLVRDKTEQFSKNVIGWLKSNPIDYPIIIPYIERIVHDHVHSQGLQWDDFPSKRNEFKPKEVSARLDKDRLTEYVNQSERLYTHLCTQLPEGIVKRHLLLRGYGTYGTIKRRGYENDGVTLFWCIMAMFKPTGADYKDKLEQAMNNMHKFSSLVKILLSALFKRISLSLVIA